MGLETPRFFQDNLERFENFSGYFARVCRSQLRQLELKQLAMACLTWVIALEDDSLRAEIRPKLRRNGGWSSSSRFLNNPDLEILSCDPASQSKRQNRGFARRPPLPIYW